MMMCSTDAGYMDHTEKDDSIVTVKETGDGYQAITAYLRYIIKARR